MMSTEDKMIRSAEVRRESTIEISLSLPKTFFSSHSMNELNGILAPMVGSKMATKSMLLLSFP